MALSVSIGQYYTARSPIHALDPRVKLVACVAYMAGCMLVGSPATLCLAAAAVVAAIACARVPAARLAAQMRPVVGILVVTSLVNLLFVRTGAPVWQVGPISIHAGGIEAAVLYTVRFLLLLLAGSLLMLTCTPQDLADAAEYLLRPLERHGVPVGRACVTFSIALRFVPVLSHEARRVVDAQRARGAGIEGKGPLAYARACAPLIVPLVASALRHAENLGRAMEARCYTGDARRSRYREMRLVARRDGPFIALVIIYLAALVILRLMF